MSRKSLAAAGLLATALTATLAPSAQAASASITRAEYDKVKLGATVAKLHSTAGSGACKKTSSSSSPGYSSKTYTCKGNKRGSTASFLFVNSKLELKSQGGLDGRTSNGKMTKAKYKKITKGKTVAQMHAVAGRGVCVRTADAEAKGAKSAVYTCEQKSPFGVASFSFTNGKLNGRSQFGLR
ncbi:hypothetical protein GCM10018785_06030 [Streptomyces longispororuber]|uniref:Uncharacterized protein n=1 Tax=Streptomyces longispororuber TaxID=68230 RepID=A0A918Z987_9ACTN|nr:hypothetical protein [Streptomyces longispororuber]GHE39223.1 hypothetical protein GCM10018785_06030 [Streptomyces longispororuber]